MIGRWKKLLNFVCFQVGWFACALGAASGWPLLGPLVVGVLLVLQLPLVPAPGKQARFVLVAMLAGWLIDSGLDPRRCVFLSGRRHAPGLCPLWMAALWANFAGTLPPLPGLVARALLAGVGARRLRRAAGLLRRPAPWRNAAWQQCRDKSSGDCSRVGACNAGTRRSVGSRKSRWLETVVRIRSTPGRSFDQPPAMAYRA